MKTKNKFGTAMNCIRYPENFAELEDGISSYENSKAVILPVPYEKTATYVKGTGKGPQAIISASRNMEIYDEELKSDISKAGICTLEKLDIREGPEPMADIVADNVKRLINDGKFPIIIGGEHSITVGCVKAFNDNFEDLSVLQLDAHADLREEYGGSRFSHACPMRRVLEINKNLVQVGIRSLSPEEADFLKRNRMEVFLAKDIFDNCEWADKAISKLAKNVYITLDLDVFDPSIMPSTGTPEPGGLEYYPVLGFLRGVFERRNVLGFDVVELCPNENNVSPDFTAAKVIYKMIGYKFSKELH